MVDTNALRVKIKDSNLRKEEICSELGISLGSLNNKLSNRTSFTLPEAKGLQKILGMSDIEAISVFFGSEVSKIETRRSDNV